MDETLPAGEHEASWDGVRDDGVPVASGVYYYRLQAGAYSKTMRMVLIK